MKQTTVTVFALVMMVDVWFCVQHPKASKLQKDGINLD